MECIEQNIDACEIAINRLSKEIFKIQLKQQQREKFKQTKKSETRGDIFCSCHESQQISYRHDPRDLSEVLLKRVANLKDRRHQRSANGLDIPESGNHRWRQWRRTLETASNETYKSRHRMTKILECIAGEEKKITD